MNIETTFQKDIRSRKKQNGAYEWWYFDAVSDDEQSQFVVIFYEGNPFSRRYMNRQQQGGAPAGDFPAVSISVYREGRPVFYSFTEYPSSKANFGEETPQVQVGDNTMCGTCREGELTYTLNLDEQLPSGDFIEGQLKFMSSAPHATRSARPAAMHGKHQWHLIQPRARVEGNIRYSRRAGGPADLAFKGRGYHDHNMGAEPLRDAFADWYWGRFHFRDRTLIYYVTGKDDQDAYGWILDHAKPGEIISLSALRMEDYGRTLYGMKSARQLLLIDEASHTRALIQQEALVDNGPFYQRFMSRAYLYRDEAEPLQGVRGISEYLCPPRIYHRRYWPLTNMRIRYLEEKPHWVQRSKRFYRWTW